MKKVTKTDAIQRQRFIATLFGEPGVGKTTLSFTAPKALFFDFDRGVHRAAQNIRPDYYQIDDFGYFWDYLHDGFTQDGETYSAEADIAANGYETFIIDTAGSMLDDFMAPWLMSQNPSYSQGAGLSLRGWGAMKTMFNQLKARVQALGCHLFFVAHDKEEGGESIRKIPALSGGSSEILKRASDIIMWMGVKGNKKVVSAEPCHAHIGKNIIGMPDTPVPHITHASYPTFFTDIFAAIEEKMKEQSEAQIKARAVIEEHFALLDAADSPAKFDGIAAGMKDITGASIIAQVRKKMKVRLKETGIEFDKDSGKFVWSNNPDEEETPKEEKPKAKKEKAKAEADDKEMSEADWENVEDPHAEAE